MNIDVITFRYRNATGKYLYPSVKIEIPTSLLTAFSKCEFCIKTDKYSGFKVPFGKISRTHIFFANQLIDKYKYNQESKLCGLYFLPYLSMLFLIKDILLPTIVSLTIYNEDREELRYFEGNIKNQTNIEFETGFLQLRNRQISLVPNDLKRKRESDTTEVNDDSLESGEIKRENDKTEVNDDSLESGEIKTFDNFASSTYEDLERLF